MSLQPDLAQVGRDLALEPVEVNRRAGCPLLRRLEENERFLRRFCEQLSNAARTRPLAAKEAWLLDNYLLLHTQFREVREALPRGYYRGLPRMKSGRFRGHPRVYRLVSELVERCGSKPDLEQAGALFRGFQEIQPLDLAELWAIGPTLKLVLLERLSAAARDAETGEADVRSAILALRALESVSWRDFVESICPLEQILRSDPAGYYARMDFETRDAYRHAIEAVAKSSGLTERDVARLAIGLAQQAAASGQGEARETHVGYYLVGAGAKLLRKRAGCRGSLRGALRELCYRNPNALYLGGVFALTVLGACAIWKLLGPASPWWLALLLIPASQFAVTAVNSFVHWLVPPRRLPRLDFSEGIPDDARTFVVIPALLLSRPVVGKLLERLEIHYLANRDPNLFFALLTDWPDSPQAHGPQDHLLDLCAEGIRLLNERYGGPFYLFHRNRQWNESESVWMGRERKRGKLLDFNRLLLGEADAFAVKIGDLSVLPTIRYVITLDSDTQLPRDTARKLIATLAHPLNRPVIDPATNTVREGYAVLQPRITISMESAARSRLARIYSGQTGYDPYTTAVSDVYQDLHAQASFTGKGIYDVRAFQQVAGARFPDNTLLSHDLIEGEYARTGLVTDLELIDDYPSTYEAYSKRKHRWVRGDWQILRWLFRRVPVPGGAEPNPLSLLSRWKIADNLRRSLLEISLLALQVAALLDAPSPYWNLLPLVFLASPYCIEFVFSMLRLMRARFRRSAFREAIIRLGQGHFEALLGLTFVVHQACVMADAIIRTLVRVFITRRKLLEWETMAQTEMEPGTRVSLIEWYLFAPPVLALLVVFCLPHSAGLPAFAILQLWMLSPAAAMWLNGSPGGGEELSADDIRFLHDASLQTWRFFNDFCCPEHNWLAPDNVQEDPPAVAARASPTNIGLLLAANFAAHDFGYLTSREAAERTARSLGTLVRLERYRGHFFNWYDTRALAPLAPRFVSTVDSGNLAAALITVKQGCLELLDRPAIELRLLSGIRDHVLRLRNVLPPAGRSDAIMRLLDSLLRQLEYEPVDLFFWESVLSEADGIIERLRRHLDLVCSRLAPAEAGEVRYWAGRLVERLGTALDDLYRLAPWLSRPFELEIRLRAADPSLRELIRELERVPTLRELPRQYDAIASGIRTRLKQPPELHPNLRQTLEALLEALPAARAAAEALLRSLEQPAAAASALVDEMDFAFLFDPRRKLLHIGFNADSGKLEEGYYDLLASEARTAVFVAIAKGDIPREAWFHLGRKLTACEGQRTLVSWAGTMFEYLMPTLFMKTYENTLLAESLRAAVRIHQAHGKARGLPWGVSEAAYSARDSNLSYQYRAFGVPEIALNRAVPGELVIAPYASALALMVSGSSAAANLRNMAERGWTGAYGFFDSFDCATRQPVRTFMAHHQGMTLLALSNALLGNPVQQRFHADPLVRATEFLLQERVPLLFTAAKAESLPAPSSGFHRTAPSRAMSAQTAEP